MDWALKASPHWDLTELDRDDFDALAYTAKIRGNSNKEVISVDLGLHILADGATNKLDEPNNPSMASWPSRLSKKPRVHTSDQSVQSCLVDRCTADLSSCKDYHQRHRVCESHSKTPVVTIDGREQRFCQQCSRFHSLGEFDEEKRSCRKRLDGHNKRRRKPRAESMYLNYGNFLSNHQGTNLLQFDGSPAYMAKSRGFLTWSSEENYHQNLHVTVQQNTSNDSYARPKNGKERKFPFLLAPDSDKGDQTVPERSFSQQFLNPNSSFDRMGENSEKSRRLAESKGALSLLSKQTTHTSGITPTNLFQHSETSVKFNGLLNHHLGSLTPSGSPDGSRTNNHVNGMIRFQPEGLLETGASQLVSFSWK